MPQMREICAAPAEKRAAGRMPCGYRRRRARGLLKAASRSRRPRGICGIPQGGASISRKMFAPKRTGWKGSSSAKASSFRHFRRTRLGRPAGIRRKPSAEKGEYRLEASAAACAAPQGGGWALRPRRPHRSARKAPPPQNARHAGFVVEPPKKH
ncbi:MAG: hypothetical protein LBU32_16630 [Clostridiales bacterium]|nr:hypothetical protein [Clostridiales bacterium]